jgi:hypothetical protein
MDELTAQEEIAFIKKVMQDSRKVIYTDGIEFIYWGVIVTICLIFTYFTAGYHITNPINIVSMFWLIFMLLGGAGSSIFIKKKYRHARVKSLAGNILGKIWLANGTGMILTAFVGSFSGAIRGVFISPLMCCFLGCSYFISGFIYGKKWISYLAFLWWFGAIIMFIFPGLYVLLLTAAMMILFQITPGVILYKNSKQEFAKTE